MPTAISHIIAGSVAGYTLSEDRNNALLWMAFMLLSVLPDFDVAAFSLGIPYAHTFGHRGFFHSLAFCFLCSLFFAMLFYYRKGTGRFSFVRGVAVFFIVSSLHPVLDMFTNGGMGIGLFIPFSNCCTNLQKHQRLVILTNEQISHMRA